MYVSIDPKKYRNLLFFTFFTLVFFPGMCTYVYIMMKEKNLELGTLLPMFIIGVIYTIWMILRLINMIRIHKLKHRFMELENGYLTIQNRLLFRMEKIDVSTIESIKFLSKSKNIVSFYRIVLKPESRGSGLYAFIKEKAMRFSDILVNASALNAFINTVEKESKRTEIRL